MVALNDDSTDAEISAFRLWLSLGCPKSEDVRIHIATIDGALGYSACFEDIEATDRHFDSANLVCKRTYRVYGSCGHRNRVSFIESFELVDYKGIAYIVRCADKTGTHEYVEVQIYASDEYRCDSAILAQNSDGIFEDSNTGDIIVVDTGEEIDYFDGHKLRGKHISYANLN